MAVDRLGARRIGRPLAYNAGATEAGGWGMGMTSGSTGSPLCRSVPTRYSLRYLFSPFTFICVKSRIHSFHIRIGRYSLRKLSFFPQFSSCGTEVRLPFLYSFIITHKMLYLAVASRPF